MVAYKLEGNATSLYTANGNVEEAASALWKVSAHWCWTAVTIAYCQACLFLNRKNRYRRREDMQWKASGRGSWELS
jgi:hypothetical protein